MHITPVSFKPIHFTIFWIDQTLRLFVSFQKICFHLKKCLSRLCLRRGAYLNGTSNVFAYLLIIFLENHWFGFFLINEDALDSLRNDASPQMAPFSSN